MWGNIKLLSGWGTWIRTKIDGVRVRSSTVELSPNGDPLRRVAVGLLRLVSAPPPVNIVGAQSFRLFARLRYARRLATRFRLWHKAASSALR